ncbi:MAG: hypothetical protein VX726_00010 [Planctomycetota bacterium]|nr:hypothetical protein [Planctomycetota bacterium]
MHPNESRTTHEAGGWFHRLSGVASSIGVVLVVVAGVLVSPTDRPFLEPSSATGRIGLVDSGLLDSGRAGSGSTQADFQRTPFKLEVMPVRRFDPLADDARLTDGPAIDAPRPERRGPGPQEFIPTADARDAGEGTTLIHRICRRIGDELRRFGRGVVARFPADAPDHRMPASFMPWPS